MGRAVGVSIAVERGGCVHHAKVTRLQDPSKSPLSLALVARFQLKSSGEVSTAGPSFPGEKDNRWFRLRLSWRRDSGGGCPERSGKGVRPPSLRVKNIPIKQRLETFVILDSFKTHFVYLDVEKKALFSGSISFRKGFVRLVLLLVREGSRWELKRDLVNRVLWGWGEVRESWRG